MAGLLGYENPFLRGMMGARAQNENSAQNEITRASGLLSLQNARTQQQQMQKDQELKGLLGQKLAAGDMEGAKGLLMQYKPELFAKSMIPQAPKWQVSERFNQQTGRPEKVMIDLNNPSNVQPFGGQKAPTLSFGPDGVARDMSSVTPGTVAQDPSKTVIMGPNGPMVNPLAVQARSQIAAAGRPTTNVKVNLPAGDNKYLETRRANDANSFKDLEKAGQSAYNQYSTLDRFIKASEKGLSGGAAPVIASVQNFISSFGYEPESLKDYRVMEQAIGDILGNKMAELGARGLTDKDMEILRQALPRVEIDKNSRVEVAKIMKKAASKTLNEYHNARQEEARIYPDLANRTMNPAWYKAYMANPGAFNPEQARGPKFLGFE